MQIYIYMYIYICVYNGFDMRHKVIKFLACKAFSWQNNLDGWSAVLQKMQSTFGGKKMQSTVSWLRFLHNRCQVFSALPQTKTWNTTYIVIKWVIYLEKIPRDLFRTPPRKQHDKQKTCPYSQDGFSSGLLRTLSQVLGPWSGHPQSVWKCCV